jgi:hypothetical protein
VTDEFVPKKGAKGKIFDILRSLAVDAQEEDSMLTFWVQDRIGTSDTRSEDEHDESVYVLLRCKNKQAFKAFVAQERTGEWERVGQLSENRRTTTWVESGIGFIGR